MLRHAEQSRRGPSDQPVILVVDDETLVVNIARAVLERDGYVILTAENGEEALELSRQFPGSIDAVVTDIVMPGIDGVELRDRLVMERPGIKVLLMSAHVRARAAVGPFLQKPFHIRALKEQVRQLLSSAPVR